MKRVIAKLPKDEEVTSEILHGARDDNWEYIDEKTTSTDLEKGLEDKEVILKRKSDGKYFKFEYSRSGHHSLDDEALGNIWPLKGKEVFRKEVKTVVYL